MFLESSLDVLYIVLSLAVLWFTVFLCWLLYQAARVLKNANDIIENVNRKLEIVVDAVEFMREKVDKMSSHMNIVSRLASTLVEKVVLGPLSSKMDEALSKKAAKKQKTTRKKDV
jgi:uncharacterized protein YoxC